MSRSTNAGAQVTVAGCDGQVVLSFKDGNAPRGIYSQPVDGQFPPVLLYRAFYPMDPACHPQCDDELAVQLTKE